MTRHQPTPEGARAIAAIVGGVVGALALWVLLIGAVLLFNKGALPC